MSIINIKLSNCYGIKKLEKDFDFSTENTFAIYAPNGVMKTSFAKTFKDVSANLTSKDLIFVERKTIREIKKDDGSELKPNEVFVIEPYNENFNSTKISTLLVNKDLKEQYDSIHLKIDEEKEKLLKELRKLSGLKNQVEDEISRTFTSEDNRLFDSLGRVEKEVLDSTEPQYSDISYNQIFNDKVQTFLKTKDFKDKIEEYIKKYEELIDGSKYFKKGVFNHNNASTIADSLMKNGFFEAKHSIYLNAKDGKNEIHTKADLEKIIDEEKNSIINNPDLVKVFEELDTKLKANQELRDFRDYLLNNLKILPELKNIESLRQKLWVSYFKSHKELYSSFVNEYQSAKTELDKIISQAKIEETKWLNVIEIFNKRFSVPFKLSVRNQDDVILKRDIPAISFIFKDQENEITVKKDDLLQALSNGEKRALYILNIIFEVEARKQDMQETLFIIDDIADSFDYKNKYAIIEYLKDISEVTNFKQIVLTHNFDFFRTIQSRFVPYDNCLMVEKTSEEIKIEKAEYIRNPFKYWMQHLDDDKKLVASIPFVRNIIEYTNGETGTDYAKLTSLLHIKSDTDTILKSDLQNIYNAVFPTLSLTLSDANKKVVDFIFELADTCLTATESINLENKILLSIAIRLRAEEFILSKVTDKSEVEKNQTRKLFERFKVEFATTEQDTIKLLESVNLMTPENIHFNSFMYEPILDMSDEHLKTLYTSIKSL
jgi:hypothetical protein